MFRYGVHMLHAYSSQGVVVRMTSKRTLTTNLFVVGKKNSGEKYVIDGCNDYERRLKSVMNIQTIYCKNDTHLVDSVHKIASSKGILVALDECGSHYTSVEFSRFLYDSFEAGGSQVSFIIGGPAGLPTSIKQNNPLISLSNMTWPYQLTRLLLLEQIYRGVEIRKGSSYHKD